MSDYFDQIYYEVIRSLGGKESRRERVKNALLSFEKYALVEKIKTMSWQKI